LLEGIAGKMADSAAVFGELAETSGHEKFVAISGRLKPLETEADNLCHQLYEELDRVFVTPIDREDLAALTKALDDVIDGMEHTAAFAALYRFDGLTEPMRQLVRITAASTAELARAVRRLRNFGDPELIRGPTVAVPTLAVLVLVVALALVFDYINGFHDTANAVATVVSTGVLPGRTAVLLAAACNFAGAFAGVGVAKTIGQGIAEPASVTQLVVAAAL